MIAVRVVLVVAGLVSAGYGALLLLDHPPVVLLRIAMWAAAGVLLHDFVFAPVCAALGWAGGRILPAAVRGPLAVAGLALVVLGLLAIPVFDKPGARPDNATVLDRDYHLGLLLACGAILVALSWYLLARRLLPTGQDDMVDQQRADDVERQPKSV